MKDLTNKLEKARKFINYNYEKFIVSKFLGNLLLGHEVDGYDYSPLISDSKIETSPLPDSEIKTNEMHERNGLFERIKKSYKPNEQLSTSFIDESGNLFLGTDLNTKKKKLYAYAREKGFNDQILGEIIHDYCSTNGRRELADIIYTSSLNLIDDFKDLATEDNVKAMNLFDLLHYKQKDFDKVFLTVSKEGMEELFILSVKSFLDIVRIKLEGTKYKITKEDEAYINRCKKEEDRIQPIYTKL